MRIEEDKVLEIAHCLVPEVLSLAARLLGPGRATSLQLKLDLEQQQEPLSLGAKRPSSRWLFSEVLWPSSSQPSPHEGGQFLLI